LKKEKERKEKKYLKAGTFFGGWRAGNINTEGGLKRSGSKEIR